MCCLALGLLAACSDGSQGPPPPPLVTVWEVTRADASYPGQYQGQTQGSRAAQVVARVQGVIRKRVYEEGGMVEANALLFQLEPDTYQAAVASAGGALAQAEAQLDRATREWARIAPLYAKNAVSQKDRDNALSDFNAAQANVVAAKAALQTAQINLNYCSVLSPVRGLAGKEAYTVGNFVTNGQVLTTVNQVDPLYVNFSAPGSFVMRLQQLEQEGRLTMPQEGFSARIRLLNGNMYAREGRVTFVDKQVDPSTGAVRMRAEFPNPEGMVLPGQFVRVFIDGARLKNAVLIPQKAVLQTQRGDLVMVVTRDNTIEARPVQISDAIGKNFLVDKGLAAGERIVLEGVLKARPGQSVRVDVGGPGGGQTPGGGPPGGPGGAGAPARDGKDKAGQGAAQGK
jgi:membrane fusion protein (multidrug efflux system)